MNSPTHKEAFFQLFANSPDVLARFDRAERHLMVSPSVEGATGLKPEALIGKTTLEAGFSPEHAAMWSRFLQKTFETGEGGEMEFEFSSPGGLRCFHVLSVPEFGSDGSVRTVLAFARDITQRREIEIARQAVLDRLTQEVALRTALVAALPIPVYFKDCQGRYTGCNPACVAFTGVPEEGMLGKTAGELWEKGLAAKYRASDDELLSSGGTQVYEAVVRAADGTDRAVVFRKSVFRGEDGKIAGLVGCFTDISEFRAKAAALEEARSEAAEDAQAKSEFLAAIGHELRTPLNGAIGFTSLLMATPLDFQQREFCLAVRESTESLLQLINDILDFSRLEAGRMELDSAEFDVNAVCHPALILVAPLAEKKGLDLCYRIAEDAPQRIAGDASRLRQIILNLLGNAVKFTSEGVVELTLGRGIAANGTPALTIAVRDTGIGISPDQQHRIFTPYQQANSGISKKFGGTGLGLSISRHLAERMGGDISLASQPGVGSTFTLTVPLGPEQEPASPPARPLAGKVVGLLASRPTCIGAVSQALSQAGARVRILPEDVGAEEGDPDPDAIVLDGRFGARKLEEIVCFWRERRGANFRIVLIVPATADARALASLDCSCVLSRPPDPRLLIRTVLGCDSSAEISPCRSQAGFADRHPLRILVGEDDPTSQVVTLALLRGMGYLPDVVENGEEVVRAVETDGYDLVFLDLRMPVMDGFDAARAIHALPGKSTRPLLVGISAWVVENIEARCAEAGMNGFLAKPFQTTDLAACLRRVAGTKP